LPISNHLALSSRFLSTVIDWPIAPELARLEDCPVRLEGEKIGYSKYDFDKMSRKEQMI